LTNKVVYIYKGNLSEAVSILCMKTFCYNVSFTSCLRCHLSLQYISRRCYRLVSGAE